MAIQATHVDAASGAKTPKAYIAVLQILLRYSDGAAVDVRLGVWAGAKARKQGLAPVREFWLTTRLGELGKHAHVKDGADLRLAVYRWLKKRVPENEQQPDFRKATDI